MTARGAVPPATHRGAGPGQAPPRRPADRRSTGRRLAALAVVVVVLVAAAAAVGLGRERGGAAPVAAPPPVIRYVVLGDSIATGAGSATSYPERYAALLKEHTGSRIDVTGLAANGWTSTDLRAAVEEDPSLRAAIADAHTLTWNIGGNDLLRVLPAYATGTCGGDDNEDCLRAAVAAFRENWQATLAEIVALRGADVTGLRTMDLYDPSPGGAAFAALTDARRYLDEVNATITATAAVAGVPVADVHATFNGTGGERDPVADGLLADDRIHPSDDGHAAIAERLAALGLEVRVEP